MVATRFSRNHSDGEFSMRLKGLVANIISQVTDTVFQRVFREKPFLPLESMETSTIQLYELTGEVVLYNDFGVSGKDDHRVYMLVADVNEGSTNPFKKLAVFFSPDDESFQVIIDKTEPIDPVDVRVEEHVVNRLFCLSMNLDLMTGTNLVPHVLDETLIAHISHEVQELIDRYLELKDKIHFDFNRDSENDIAVLSLILDARGEPHYLFQVKDVFLDFAWKNLFIRKDDNAVIEVTREDVRIKALDRDVTG